MISKKAHIIKKARSQKYYYETLKVAAELDELEEKSSYPSRPTSKAGNLIGSLVITYILVIVGKFGVNELWKKISLGPLRKEMGKRLRDLEDVQDLDIFFSKAEDLAPGMKEYYKQVFHKSILSFAVVVYAVATVIALNIMFKAKESMGMTWVEYVKYLFKSGKNRIQRIFDKLLRRPTPEVDVLLKVSIKKDGSLDKSAVKNYIKNSVTKR